MSLFHAEQFNRLWRHLRLYLAIGESPSVFSDATLPKGGLTSGTGTSGFMTLCVCLWPFPLIFQSLFAHRLHRFSGVITQHPAVPDTAELQQMSSPEPSTTSSGALPQTQFLHVLLFYRILEPAAVVYSSHPGDFQNHSHQGSPSFIVSYYLSPSQVTFLTVVQRSKWLPPGYTVVVLFFWL